MDMDVLPADIQNNIMKRLIIECAEYQGYVWYSDQKEPEIIDGTYQKDITSEENPFIIEAQLYAPKANHSISVRYVDGEYIVNQYDLSAESANALESRVREYMSNRMDGCVLCFKELWKAEQDPYCEDFYVLEPKDFIFIGFKRK